MRFHASLVETENTKSTTTYLSETLLSVAEAIITHISNFHTKQLTALHSPLFRYDSACTCLEKTHVQRKASSGQIHRLHYCLNPLIPAKFLRGFI
jgi:hypothetical protein